MNSGYLGNRYFMKFQLRFRWFRHFALLLGIVISPCLSVAENKQLRGTRDSDSSKELIDMVLASVDGDPLTMSDLRSFIVSRGDTPPKDLLDGSPGVRNYLREMVVDEVVSREASATGLSVSKEEIQAYVEEIQRQNGVNEKEFEKLLAGKGLTIDAYEKQVKTDILKTRLLSSRVRSKVNVLDSDIEKYASKHDDVVPKTGERRFEQVAIAFDPNDPLSGDAAKERAETLREKVIDGSSLEDVGGEDYSDLGAVAPRDLLRELQKPAESLEQGEVSKPIRLEGKYVILRHSGEVERRSLDKEEKDRIRKEMFEKAFKEEAEKYLNEELPRKYHVELKL